MQEEEETVSSLSTTVNIGALSLEKYARCMRRVLEIVWLHGA